MKVHSNYPYYSETSKKSYVTFMSKHAYRNALMKVEDEYVCDGRKVNLSSTFFSSNIFQLPFLIGADTMEQEEMGFRVTSKGLTEFYDTTRIATQNQLYRFIHYVAKAVHQHELESIPEEPDERLAYFEDIYRLRDSLMSNITSYIYGLDIQQSKSHKHMPADMELLSFINFLKVHTIAAGNNNNRVFNFDDYVLLVFTH